MGRSAANGFKTFMLFTVFAAILLGVGAYLGGGYIIGFGILAIVMSGAQYWFSDKLALKQMHARQVTEVEQPAMYRIVRELSQAANKPMPRLYVSPTAAPNAFATGRNPRNAAVCCTEGILQLLDERELRGVLGHELQHVYNRDILIGSVAAVIATTITWVAQMALWFGGSRRNANPLVLIAMMVLAPLAATIIRMAVTRTREYEADRSGAELTGDPMALASALQKIEAGANARPLQPTPNLESMSHLMISNPFRGGGLTNLFRTHPPTADRVARLSAMHENRGFIH